MTLFLVAFILWPHLALAQNWEAEWARTVAEARKEGKLSIYGAPGIDRLSLYKDHFERAFPGIKVEYTTGSELTARIMSERRARKYLADVYIHGVSSVTRYLLQAGAIRPARSALILPEVLDGSRWAGGALHFADRERKYIVVPSLTVSTILAVNTDLVKGLSSYRELLEDRWHGKIVSPDFLKSRVGSGIGGIRFFYLNPHLGSSFISSLYRSGRIVLSRDTRQMADWLARGRFAYLLFSGSSEIDKARDQGLPVDVINPKRVAECCGMSSGGNTTFLLNPSPHPNGATVFLNWSLSREGQIAFEKILQVPSLRRDTPKKGIKEYLIPEGPQYVNTNAEEYWHIDDEVIPLISEALGEK